MSRVCCSTEHSGLWRAKRSIEVRKRSFQKRTTVQHAFWMCCVVHYGSHLRSEAPAMVENCSQQLVGKELQKFAAHRNMDNCLGTLRHLVSVYVTFSADDAKIPSTTLELSSYRTVFCHFLVYLSKSNLRNPSKNNERLLELEQCECIKKTFSAVCFDTVLEIF